MKYHPLDIAAFLCLMSPGLFVLGVCLWGAAAVVNPDFTQAAFEAGSACFQVLNVRAIRKSKALAGVHWIPTAFFGAWGVYNLWFYSVINLPLAWWAGLLITCTNAVWLGHVAWYAAMGAASAPSQARSPQPESAQ